MLRVLWLVQNHDWVWQQRGCVISSHFQQISLVTGYVLIQIDRYTTDNKQDHWTRQQSNLLKRVNLRVSNTEYKHSKMFGTEVEFKRGDETPVSPGIRSCSVRGYLAGLNQGPLG